MLNRLWSFFLSVFNNVEEESKRGNEANDLFNKQIVNTDTQSILNERMIGKFSDCIFIFNNKGVCSYAIDANSPSANIVEVLGKNWREIGFPIKMRDSLFKSFEVANRSQRVVTGQTLLSFVVGNRYFEYTIYPVKVLDEGQEFTILVMKDITARKWNEEELKIHREQLEELVKGRTYDLIRSNAKLQQEIVQKRQAEEEARQSEATLRRITNAMQDMICQINQDGVIEYASPSYLTAVGYNPDNMVGQNLIEFIHPDDKDKVLTVFRNSNIGAGHVEFRHLHINREYLWVETVWNTLQDQQGIIRGVILCTRDITERKRLENEMVKLDRLNLVGEMAASIAHEIRNPMTTIRGFLQVLKDKEGCKPYSENFELMIEELDRANSIISEYLSLAKRKAVNLDKGDINAIIQTITPLLQSDALTGDKNLQITLGVLREFLLDEKEIRQLIINLVRNGLEAMTAGGTLTIKTYMDGEDVVLSIKDEGVGIPPADLEKLGTPFFTTKDNGNGLGLPVCYSIASRHNATISFETGASGTTFYVKFGLNSISR